MFGQLTDQQAAVLRLAVVTSGALLVACLVNRAGAKPLLFGAKSLAEERERLLELLQEATRRFFLICMSIQGAAKRARDNIAAHKVEVTDAQIRQLLEDQCEVREKLRKVITEVLACSSDDFHEVQLRHQDPEVSSFLSGFEAMLNTALGGLPPVLPNARIPDVLTEDLVLQILGETFTLELGKIVKRLGGQQVTRQELMEVRGNLHREALLEALGERVPELQGRKDAFEVYYSTLGIFMASEGFAAKRATIDSVHQHHQARVFSVPLVSSDAAAAAAPAAASGAAVTGSGAEGSQPADAAAEGGPRASAAAGAAPSPAA